MLFVPALKMINESIGWVYLKSIGFDTKAVNRRVGSRYS